MKKQSFKQFLMLEDDDLETLVVELWFRRETKSRELGTELMHWFYGKDEDLTEAATEWFYNYFAYEMPYDVAKGDGNLTVEEWVHPKFYELFKRLELISW